MGPSLSSQIAARRLVLVPAGLLGLCGLVCVPCGVDARAQTSHEAGGESPDVAFNRDRADIGAGYVEPRDRAADVVKRPAFTVGSHPAFGEGDSRADGHRVEGWR